LLFYPRKYKEKAKSHFASFFCQAENQEKQHYVKN
jgi:hypothetical protein